jgi:hypothetical protein
VEVWVESYKKALRRLGIDQASRLGTFADQPFPPVGESFPVLFYGGQIRLYAI